MEDRGVDKGEAGVGLGARLFVLAARPLSLYWALIVIVAGAGLIATVRTGELAWKRFAVALVLAGLVRFLAQIEGVRPWPWS